MSNLGKCRRERGNHHGRECIPAARKASFTTVYRSVAQDKRISLKARGLFLLMQSLPEDWEYTISGLATVAGTGKDPPDPVGAQGAV